MEEDAFWGIAGGALEAELGGGGVGVDFQFEGDGAELGGDVVEAGEAAGLDPFSGEGLEEVELVGAFEDEAMADEPDELSGGPVVGHIADEGVALALGHMLFAPDEEGRGVIGEGIEGLDGLVAVTEPEPGVGVEGAEVVPEAIAEPAGIEDEAFGLDIAEHGHISFDEGVIGGEDLAGENGVEEGPLSFLRGHAGVIEHVDGEAIVAGGVFDHVAFSSGAEGGVEVVVFFLPGVGLVGLFEPMCGVDSGFHASQGPIDVGVFRAFFSKAAVGETGGSKAAVGGIGFFGGGDIADRADEGEGAFEVGPNVGKPGLVAGEFGVACDGPEDDAGFFPVAVDEHEAAVAVLVLHEVADAVAGFVGAVEEGDGFHEEGAIDDPEAAIAGWADLEGWEVLFDFAGLVDVADGRVEKCLDAGVADGDLIEGEVGVEPPGLGGVAEGGDIGGVVGDGPGGLAACDADGELAGFVCGEGERVQIQDDSCPGLFGDIHAMGT